MYIVCLHAAHLRDEIFESSETKNMLFSFGNPQAVFVQALAIILSSENNESVNILEEKCQSGHRFGDNFKLIASRFFNVMCKNFISEENDKLHEARKRKTSKESKTQRKIAKLQGDCWIIFLTLNWKYKINRDCFKISDYISQCLIFQLDSWPSETFTREMSIIFSASCTSIKFWYIREVRE